MKVKRLTIEEVPSWERTNRGKMTAKVEYEGAQGEIAIMLDSEVAVRLLEICATLIAEFSRKAANEIADAVMLTVKEAKQPTLELPKVVDEAAN